MAWTVKFLGLATGGFGNSTLQLGSDTNANASSVPAGALILVGAVEQNASFNVVGSVSDDLSNSYSLVSQSYNSTSGRTLQLFACYNATALASGKKIYYTDQVGGDLSYVFAAYATGNLSSATSYDKTSSGTGTSTTPSSGATGTTSVAGELCFGVASTSGTATVSSLGASWTSADSSSELFSYGFAAGYLVDGGTSSETFTATLTSSDSWNAIIASFKPIPAIPVSFNMPMMGL